MITQSLVEKLTCPECCSPLAVEPDRQTLRCIANGHQFPIVEDVPILHPLDQRDVNDDVMYREVPSGQPRKRGAVISLLRGALHLWMPIQQRLIPMTPLRPPYHLKQFQPLIRELPTPKSILDAGGGSSPYRQYVASATDDYVVLEVDRIVTDKRDDRSVVIGDVHTLPFCDEQFDLILLTEVLEHLYDPIRAIGHLARTLKPGGLIFLTTPQYWHVHGWPSDYYRYTNYGLEYLCRRSGLECVRTETQGGPGLLLYSVIKLNFLPFLNLPVIRLLLDVPLVYAFWGLDRLFFSSNRNRHNPDTRGWAMLVRKPGTESAGLTP